MTIMSVCITAATLLGIVGAAHAEDAVRADPALSDPSMSADRCAIYGPGYMPVAGTSTCVKIGGRVRVDTSISGSRSGRGGTEFSIQTRSD